ncbi:MAG: hypothetical protein R2762_15165 [Bryobacteraceae bacterium]
MSAAQAYGMLVAGILLVYLECCRPGWVIPGAAGSVLMLLAAARMWEWGVTGAGLGLIALGAALLAAEALLRWPGIPGAAGAAVMAWGATRLIEGRPMGWMPAVALSYAVALATVLLGSLAWKGYWAKRAG